MSGFVEAVRGRIDGLIRGRRRMLYEAGSTSPGREAAQFIKTYEERIGEPPSISFAAQLALYIADLTVRAGVDYLGIQVAGPGFYTTAEPKSIEYREEAERAKEIVDGFNERVNMDGLLVWTARDCFGFGNCFWNWNRDRSGLKIIPIVSIEKVERTKEGVLQGYRQRPEYGGKLLKPDDVVHFCWNPVNSEALGSGLLRSLCEELTIRAGEIRPSPAEMKARMQKAMIEQFEKFSGPNEVWVFKNLPADELSTYAKRLKKIPPKGARFAYNDEASIEMATQQIGRGWEAWVDNIMNEYGLGLETPITKLFTTPGFTEASARAAVEAAERFVMAMQRYIKRTVEREVWIPVLKKEKVDTLNVSVRLNWGQPEVPELRIEDILEAAKIVDPKTGSPIIRAEEVRNMLVKSGWELWEEEEDKSE